MRSCFSAVFNIKLTAVPFFERCVAACVLCWRPAGSRKWAGLISQRSQLKRAGRISSSSAGHRFHATTRRHKVLKSSMTKEVGGGVLVFAFLTSRTSNCQRGDAAVEDRETRRPIQEAAHTVSETHIWKTAASSFQGTSYGPNRTWVTLGQFRCVWCLNFSQVQS